MSQHAPAPTLSVVIPVYNERDLWRVLVARVEQAILPGIRKEIILVEDGSTDGTRGQVEEFNRQRSAGRPAGPGDAGADCACRVILHERNRGKGAALRTGFAAAAGDFVVVQDADLEYEPRQYGRLLKPLRDGRADVAYGNRFGRGRPPGMRLRSYLANRVLTLLSNATTGLHLADMETCYKAFRRDVLARIHLREDRFGFEPEVTSAASAAGARVIEVPITYAARSKAQGKKIGFRDGLRAVWCILRYAPLWRR